MRLICPTCEGSAVPGVEINDGNSYLCSRCNRSFHPCSKVGKCVHTSPLNCKCGFDRRNGEKKKFICPYCGGPPKIGIFAWDGGSLVCSRCEKLFHYCEFYERCVSTSPSSCECNKNNKLICPICRGRAIPGLTANDGGSSKCSKCGVLFHYCSILKKCVHTPPLNCVCNSSKKIWDSKDDKSIIDNVNGYVRFKDLAPGYDDTNSRNISTNLKPQIESVLSSKSCPICQGYATIEKIHKREQLHCTYKHRNDIIIRDSPDQHWKLCSPLTSFFPKKKKGSYCPHCREKCLYSTPLRDNHTTICYELMHCPNKHTW